MIFRETHLEGLVVVELESVEDERGSFARTFDSAAWEARGMSARVLQCSLSRNLRRGTLRGLHFQVAPDEERKLVGCSSGAIFDVAVDLRAESPTFRRWFGLELSAANGSLLYIPAGFAHGFLTLTDDADVRYQMSDVYVADASRGVRWDDPAFGIDWPADPQVISARDSAYPDFAG